MLYTIFRIDLLPTTKTQSTCMVQCPSIQANSRAHQSKKKYNNKGILREGVMDSDLREFYQ